LSTSVNQGIHDQSDLRYRDHTHRITARAIAPPITILTASSPLDGAMPTITRYSRPRVSALNEQNAQYRSPLLTGEER
jgi:hypothetical protein